MKMFLRTLNQSTKIILPISAAFFLYHFAPESMSEAARRETFVFVIAALFWSLELAPLYATSILVVVLQIFLLAQPGGVLGMKATSYKEFMAPFGSPIVILFFGGFILAHALKKYKIDKMIATRLLQLFGSKPYYILLGFMFTSAFLSMWMSDTATAAMMIAMVIPLIKQLKEKDLFRTGLILAIPFSCLVGGMGTPVGTPPNAIAIGILAEHGVHINFIEWMKMAVPLASILLIVMSIILYVMFPPKVKRLDFNIPLEHTVDLKTKSTIAIAVLTVILWLTSGVHRIPSAVIALLAACLYSITGLLDRDDLKSINWDVLILMWGGLSLGKGMEVSGLTHWIIGLPLFQQQGFVLVVLFCLLAVVLSTFISNTASANLLIPIVMVMPVENNMMMATTIALCCSLAMALPVSTPPNAIAFSTNMLKSKDMLKAGVVISAVSLLLIILGSQFVIAKTLGF